MSVNVVRTILRIYYWGQIVLDIEEKLGCDFLFCQ